jgi:hypothetical protein
LISGQLIGLSHCAQTNMPLNFIKCKQKLSKFSHVFD